MNISLRVLAGIAVVGAAAAVGADASSSSSSTSLRASRAGCTSWKELSLQINDPDKIFTQCTNTITEAKPIKVLPLRTPETPDATYTPPPTPNRCMSFVLEKN